MDNLSRKRISPSILVVLFLAFCLLFSRLLLPRFETYNSLSIISWDVFGYYLYIPATFIHHDLGLWNYAWVQQVLDLYHPTNGFYQAYQGPLGDFVMKYSCGMSILYAPLFFTGHFIAWITGAPMDGFSLPYQVSVSIGSVLYAFAGLWFLRIILLKYFSEGITAVTMILIVLGTNYFELSTYDSAMLHNYLFVLYTLIIWFTIRWYEEKQWKHGILLGLTMGLAVLVRPSEVICVLIPVFWGIRSVKERWLLLTNHFLQICAIAGTFLIIVMIQLFYWKVQTGQFFYYSYESNEKLQFLAPYLQNVLFSYKKGWLIYTPMMIFALIGFFMLYRKSKQIFIPAVIFFIINLLIVASWPTWWYGGSLGQRALMQSYVILAFPLGAFLQWLATRKRCINFGFGGVMIFFIVLNLFQTWQYINFIIDPTLMTRKYYWTVFGSTHVNATDRRYLEVEDSNEKEFHQDERNYSVKHLAYYNFEQGQLNWGTARTVDPTDPKRFSFKLSKDFAFSPGLTRPYHQISLKQENVWIRASGKVYFTCDLKDLQGNLVITCTHDGKAYKYKSIILEKETLKAGEWNHVSMDYLFPYMADANDQVQIYFWNRGEKDFWIDNFTIQLFEPVK